MSRLNNQVLIGKDLNKPNVAKISQTNIIRFISEFLEWIFNSINGLLKLSVYFYVALVKWFFHIKKNARSSLLRISVVTFFFFLIGLFSLQSTDIDAYTQDSQISYSKYDRLVESQSLEVINRPEDLRLTVVYYIVRSNKESINGVAKKFGVSADTIRWANKLSKTAKLHKGQKLKIPPGTGILHVVKKGDTLQKIANKYRASAQAIMEMNWLDPGEALTVGKEIFVPGGTMLSEESQKDKRNRHYIVYKSNNPYKPINWAPPGVGKFLTWPVKSSRRISQHYHPGHLAIDIISSAAARKRYGPHVPILAAAPGRVVFSGWKCDAYRCGYAYRIIIDHKNGYCTLYAHLQKGSLKVGVGDYVTRGQQIARMGDTGWAYGIHLHFELRKKGTHGCLYGTKKYNPLSAMR